MSVTPAMPASPAPGTRRRTAPLSLFMGAAYLGYHLVVFFLPASLLLLGWRRRWRDAVVPGFCQILPLAAWVLFLR
jgi:hypothetical protein